MAAIALLIALGFAGFAIDVGAGYQTKTKLQASADAMVLAAVIELPDQVAATDIAAEYAALNGIDAEEVLPIVFDTTCSGTAAADVITVRLERTQPTFFASLFGVNEFEPHVCATAIGGVMATSGLPGGYSLLPIGLLETDPNVNNVCYLRETNGAENTALWGSSCLIKIKNPAGSWTPGNSGGLRLDPNQPVEGNYDPSCTGSNNGAAEYEENIANGSSCAYAIGDQVQPMTGAVTGPTRQGFDERLQGNNDSFETVFGTPDANGVYNNFDASHPRFGVVPVVYIPPGASGSSQDFTIVDFVAVYIQGVGQSGPGGGPNALAEVEVIPVRARFNFPPVDTGGGEASIGITVLDTRILE